MNVLYVTQYFSLTPIHASAVTTYEIVKGLAERGHDVNVVSPYSSGVFLLFKKETEKVRVIKIFSFPRFKARWYNGFSALLTHTVAYVPLIMSALVANRRVGNFDVIVSMHHPSHMASFSAYLLSRVFKVPLIVKTHDVYGTASGLVKGLYLRFLGSLHRFVLKRADYISVVSEPLRLEIVKTHKLERHKVLVFPNGVDVRRFKPDIASGSLRSSLGVSNKKVVLFTGGLTKDRGLDLLVKAVAEIVVENQNVTVLIVGEGPQKSELEKMAQDMGVERFVKFVPTVSHEEMPRYISLADVTMGPLVARLETFGSVPRKVIEYMACAKPIVAVRGGVSSDLITDGYNGFLTRPSDVKELAAAISNAIDDLNSARKVGLNARKCVEEFYDMNKLMDQFEKVLYEASKRNR